MLADSVFSPGGQSLQTTAMLSPFLDFKSKYTPRSGHSNSSQFEAVNLKDSRDVGQKRESTTPSQHTAVKFIFL